jgi:tRNA dimethylallyltransferase
MALVRRRESVFRTVPSPLHSGTLPLLVVLGPTGAGKSELGLALAETFGGEIVNFDSVQVWRGLDIGSAKLPLGLRRGITHHLIDVVEPTQELTAGGFSRLAREALAEISRRKRLPVLVGGTGLYLRALLDGLSPAPGRNAALRERLGSIWERRAAVLHRFLRAKDEAAARRIHANDRQKLIRAIELTVEGGRPASEIQSLPRDALAGYAVLKIGLGPERRALYERIDRRSREMFSSGLIEETRGLLESGLAVDARALLSLGYRQAVAVLTGGAALEEAIRECQTKTRQYAKRQLTWFRAEREVRWLDGFGSDAEVQRRAFELGREFLTPFLS